MMIFFLIWMSVWGMPYFQTLCRFPNMFFFCSVTRGFKSVVMVMHDLDDARLLGIESSQMGFVIVSNRVLVKSVLSMGDITLLDNRTNIPNITIVYSDNIPIYQWEISRIQFMEVRKRTIFLAIYCGDIPWNLALKNRPKIYGIGTSNQSIPSRCGAFVFFLIAYPLRKSSISWTTVVPWTCWTSRLPRKKLWLWMDGK